MIVKQPHRITNPNFSIESRPSVVNYFAATFGEGITNQQFALCKELVTLLLDMSCSVGMIVGTLMECPMSDEAKIETTKKMLSVLLADRHKLEQEYAEKMKSIRGLIDGLCKNAGISAGELEELTAVELELLRKPHHEAAQWALQHLNRRASVGEIADYLIKRGYGAGIEKPTLVNSLYVAISRKPSHFQKNDDATWTLIDAKKRKEREPSE